MQTFGTWLRHSLICAQNNFLKCLIFSRHRWTPSDAQAPALLASNYVPISQDICIIIILYFSFWLNLALGINSQISMCQTPSTLRQPLSLQSTQAASMSPRPAFIDDSQVIGHICPKLWHGFKLLLN